MCGVCQGKATKLCVLWQGKRNKLCVVRQGKPTQAMKEAESLEYGGLTAKDYIPGAEILRETAEVDERQQEQGEEFRCLVTAHAF